MSNLDRFRFVREGFFFFPAAFSLIGIISILSLQNCKNFYVEKELRADAREYSQAVLRQQQISKSVTAITETDPIADTTPDDDAADDPAIWYNNTLPDRSVVFGTNKKGGIYSYDLNGKTIQYSPVGKINNIDIRQGATLGEEPVDVLVGSNRTDNSVVLFIINENGRIDKKPNHIIPLGNFEPYGLCLYKSESNALFVFVNNKFGEVHQIAVDWDSKNQLVTSIVRKLKLKTQVEGMAVDDKRHMLYVGEEQGGIYAYSAWPSASVDGELLEGSTSANPNIVFDIEGLALFPPRYLLASIQGNFSYAIFDLEKRKYLDSFIIREKNIDGVEETDGIDIVARGLNATYPNGLLVAQDGFNFDDSIKQNQNFKFVDLGEVLDLFNLKLTSN